jgi:hypothetical protein
LLRSSALKKISFTTKLSYVELCPITGSAYVLENPERVYRRGLSISPIRA